MSDYNFLNEKYILEETKVAVIQGLLMAQAMCSRKLIESYNPGIIEIMGNISKAIDNIKDSGNESV